MKEGTYIVTDLRNNYKFMLKIMGIAPFLSIQGSFDITTFLQKGTISTISDEVQEEVIKNPSDFKFDEFDMIVSMTTEENEKQNISFSKETWIKLKEIYCSIEDENAALIQIAAETKLPFDKVRNYVIPRIKQLVLSKGLI